jgi:hypothetical protein
MKIKYIACGLLVSVLAFAAGAGGLNCDKGIAGQLSDVCVIPMVKAIVAPEDVTGHYIRLTGVLHLEFEGNVLFADRFSYDEKINHNGIALAINIGDLAPYKHLNGDVAEIYGYLKLMESGQYVFIDIHKVVTRKSGVLLFSEKDGVIKARYYPKAK